MNTIHRIQEPIPTSVVVFRALQLGDMLCSIPAIRAMRCALPEAKISLVGLPWANKLVERFHHYLDDFIEFPGYPGLPERTPEIRSFPAFLSEIQSRSYDLALQMQGSGTIVNPMVMLFGAKRAAGFCEPGHFCPEEGGFMPYPQGESEVWRHLRLMEYLGIPPQGDSLEFPLLEQDWMEFRQIESQYGLKIGQYVVIHAGSRKAERRWSIDRFAELADELAARGFQIVLTGTAEELTLTQALVVQMQTHAVNLAGRTSLGCLAALLSTSRLLVCNDTGVSHLADALNIPSVVLFTAPDQDRWAPKNKDLHRVLTQVTNIFPPNVLQVVDDLLREEHVHAY